MNGKRQTIWLVSMLSLMVILSAYYLFTQGDGDLTGNKMPSGNAAEALEDGSGTIVKGGETTLSEEEILAQIEGFTQDGLFQQLAEKREQMTIEDYDRLMASIAEAGSSEEEVAAVFAEFQKFDDTNSKIQSLETMLMENYEVAHIDRNDGKYNVIVKSDAMDKSSAAKIIEEVINVMAVKPNQVSVEYVPQNTP